ncbi:histidinol-phosphatase HisJ (plasmid) [Nicoliella spurrieriana]|uniref:Histidinol-phosphatase n=1 Tax=Nicoliella spurrieriana TaxID=2925830 RepID=A0A976RQE9_9LACO|nr:histidinol-phosphatase HisJ [Nicoliella spurrieriana]UQS85923.1 histidinol-phosphatase HisJ [Nicoliella spurrieriana]
MLKIDAHTHTHLCPHGSGESTRKMVERAIQLGFSEYHITEHAPMPTNFASAFGGPLADIESEGLAPADVERYLKLATDLQREYCGQIKISVGFEIEFLADFVDQTQAFFDQYGQETQSNILSVHYLKAANGKYFGIDYDPAELLAGFATEMRAPQQLYERYLKAVLASAQIDWHRSQPLALGHISLIKKFQDYFQFPAAFDQHNQHLIDQIINAMQKHDLSLDYNAAGLYKKFGNDFYPGVQILKRALAAKIPIQFGSDAHSIDEVGHGWHMLNSFQKVLTNEIN